MAFHPLLNPFEKPKRKIETIVVRKGPPGLVKGYLEDFFDADIIVNSAPSNMKLNTAGKVSSIILERAGEAIQEECDERFPNGIQNGEVAITSGYKLPYSLVFHCTVQFMTQQNSFGEIAKLIQKCLNEADGREIQKSNNLTMAKSIAFPLLGTGPKGLSPEICHVFYQIILLFFLGPTKSLQNAFIIVKPEDSHLIQVIENLNPFDEIQNFTQEFLYPYMWQTTINNLEVINLPVQNEEYTEINEHFLSSAPPNAQVLSIQRIQNKTLYRDYITKKCEYNLIQRKYEKKLWFACDATDVTEIRTNGLNQRFIKVGRCGEGYYFYKESNAAFEVQLQSNQSQDGNHYIYCCNVAVGNPIQGNASYKNNNIPAKCTSVVDKITSPTMYTTFNENVFYPSYLLTFKMR